MRGVESVRERVRGKSIGSGNREWVRNARGVRERERV